MDLSSPSSRAANSLRINVAAPLAASLAAATAMRVALKIPKRRSFSSRVENSMLYCFFHAL